MSFTRALAVSAAALALAASNVSTADAQPAGETLHIGTEGGADATVVIYTCSNGHHICGPATAQPGRWTQTITMPRGTLVYLQVRWDRAPLNRDQYGGDLSDPATSPSCWINDAAGNRLVNGNGACIYQVAPISPRPAAPASN